MKRLSKIFLLIVAIATLSPLEEGCGEVFAQKEMRHVIHGNRDYNKEKYADAELDYRRGIDANGRSFQAQYNLGNALFRQEKYPEAAEAYTHAIQYLDKENEQDWEAMADAYHNLGNCCFASQQYKEAVAAYAMSLRFRPSDNDTRYNLAKALEMLKQQEQQQQNQQNQDQNQQQNQDQQQQQQQQDQQDQQDQQQEQQEQQEQQQDDSQMDKETAEQILQALEQDEQQTQEKMQKQQQGSKRRVEKDW